MTVIYTVRDRSVDARKVHQDAGDGWTISVTYGMSYNPPSKPLFTLVTNFQKHGERQEGPFHGLVEKYAPGLADLVAWSLCDQHGIPINYTGMANYWTSLIFHPAVFSGAFRLPDQCSNYEDALARSLRCAQIGDRDAMDRLLRQWRETKDSSPFWAWIEERKPKLRSAFSDTCRRHGLERIEIELPMENPYVVSVPPTGRTSACP
jgi:hypothetical protein